MNSVVHFEVPADDVERAQKFYSETFGWKMNSMPEMGYTMIHTTQTDERGMIQTPGAINGGMMKRQGAITSPVITINVENMQEAIERVKKNGGEMVGETLEIGDMGYAAYFKDTEGNLMGLWQTKR